MNIERISTSQSILKERVYGLNKKLFNYANCTFNVI
jgi:hypothetical protein